MTSEQQLWERLRGGDKGALEQIYRQEVDFLIQYGLKICADQPLVQDAVQDLFVQLWQRREGVNTTTAIRPYLLVALRRSVVRQMQTRSKHQDERPVEEFSFGAELSVDQLMEREELSQEQASQLQRAFQELSDRQREAVYLRYYQGMAYEEVSTIMGLNYQSVRNLVSAGIRRLRGLLALIWYILFFGAWH